MARIRSFRPDVWDCDEFVQMSPNAQLCLFRLMTHVSDEGRIKCRPAFLMSRLYPDGDVGEDWLAALLEEVCSAGFAVAYENNGKPYLSLIWNDKSSPIRQVINRPTESSIPAPDAKGSKPFNSWLTEGLMESLTASRRERLSAAGSEGSVSDSRGKGRDWTGPDWTGRESPGRSLTGPSSGSGGRRSVSGSGSAGGLASASAPAGESDPEQDKKRPRYLTVSPPARAYIIDAARALQSEDSRGYEYAVHALLRLHYPREQIDDEVGEARVKLISEAAQQNGSAS